MRKLLLNFLLLFVVAIGAFAQTSLFSEDFEGGTMPDGWTTEGPGSWSVGTGDYSNSTGAGNGSYNALIIHNASGNVTKLITPEIDLSSVTSAELSFMHVQRSWAGDYDYLKLYYRASSDDSWVEIASYTSLYASWTTEEDIVLSNTSSTYQLAFEMTDNYGYGVGIDDIQIIQHSSCSRPAALAAALTAGNGTIATLNWTESGTATEWVVEYSTAADFTGAVSENVTGTPSINITGLTAETTYYARVKAICGGGEESNWCNAINFTPTNAYSITVNDGTATNGYVPVYGYYVDNYSRSQFIIPASALTDIQWSSITHLTFYSSSGSIDWGSAEFDVRLKEVNYTTISSLEDWNDMELVYHGNLGISENVMEVTFDTPYTYLGGNLVIGTNETTSGSWSSCSWYGVTATGASMGGYGSSISQQNFLPKVTINYIPGEAPTCFKPTALAVSNIGNYNATLTWTAGADETAWQVMINDDDENIVDVEDTPTYEMTNLTSESTYSVKVRAYCDVDDQSDWSDVVTFTTLSSCPLPAGLNASNITATTADINWTGFSDSYVVRYAQKQTLFSEGFENGMPEGWTTIDSDGDGFNWESHINIGTGNHGTHSGDGVLTSASYDNDNGVALTPDNWLITPAIDLPNDAESIILQFYANGQDAAYAEEHYGVYISTTVADDTDAFTLLWEETMNANGGPHREEGVYGEKNTDLTAYAGETVYIAIRHFGVTDQFYINIDDVSVLYVSNWNTVTADASPVELTGLTPNTTYEYQVMGICGSEETAWTEISVFTTSVSCSVPTYLEVSNVTANSATLAWTAGADETAWQICINNDLDNLIDADSNTFELTGLNPDSNYAVSVRAVCGTDDESEWSNTVAFTTLPTCIVPTDLTVSDVTAHTATITWTANGSETAWQISINGDEDDLVDVDNTSYTMTDLPGDSNYYVKVRAYCDVDDQSAWTSPVPFTTLPSCTVPTDIEFTNVTATSATVSWTAGASETIWNLQYKLLSDADWTEVNGLTTNSYEITGLTAASAYSVRVQADCETEGTSTWLSGALMTLYSVPFLEEFAGSSMPARWSQKTGLLADVMGGAAFASNTGSWYFGTNNGVFDSHARVNIYGTSKKDWLLTPTIAMDANVRLTFDLALTAYSGTGAASGTCDDDKFVVLISTDNGATWTILRQYDNAGSEYVYNNIPTAGEEVAIDLTSYSTDNVIIAFYGESTVGGNGDNNLHIDNVRLDYIPSCFRPTDLSVSNVTARTAEIAWTAGADETAWQVMINDDEDGIVDVEDTPIYEMTNLAPESDYSVKVRAYCDVDDQSEWTSVNFTTGISCLAPTALAAHLTPGNGTVATLTWTENGTATAWTLEYGTASDFSDATSMDVTETPSVDLTGLTAETTYYARVKTICDVDDESSWSSVINFIPTDEYSITLNDGTETNNYVPVYGYYVDNYSRSQFIIPASDLTALQGATITKLTYYSSSASVTWTGAEFDVRLAEVDGTTVESLATWDDMTLAYHGSLGISGSVMEVTFDTPYTYMGGNLMIGTNETTSGSYYNCTWYGVNATGASMGGYESTYGTYVSQQNFLPKVTIDFIPGAPTYTITATAGENGTITPSGAVTVTEGADKEFTITADENYRILSVVVDDADVTAAVVENNGVYTFTNVTANHTIAATFVSETAVTYTITATAGEHGTITPSGAVSVVEGEDQSFVITPDADYRIDVLTVDGEVVTLSESEELGYVYAFTNVVAAHTINVTFTSLNNVEINAAASMAVYPNPNNGMFSIDFSNIEGEATYQLIDARGAVVETREINVTNGETKMFNHTLTAGTYFVRIINGDKVYVEQIVVE